MLLELCRLIAALVSGAELPSIDGSPFPPPPK
jgi:hypothetical protein